ncbi:MAG: hypothetical protein K2P51_08100 [Rhabdochlamydiaceae bacterium]|nr:hypothetical protein [Rhabdochlamydiaceae bacterium]
MKTRLFFLRLFGMFVLFGKTPFVFSADNQEFYRSAENICFQIQSVREKIETTVESLLSVPSELQTFENTIEPWIQFTDQIFRDILVLETVIKQGGADHCVLSDELNNLQRIVSLIYELPELKNHLALCAWNIIENSDKNAFQKFIASRFLNKDCDFLFCFQGENEEQSLDLATSNFVEIDIHGLYQENVVGLANTITSINPDLVCIQNIDSDLIAYALSEELISSYSNFQYFSDPVFAQKPLLIASKSSLEINTVHSIIRRLGNAKKFFWKQLFTGNTTIFHRNSVEVTASGDTEGNASLEGRLGTSQETDNGGRFSGDVSIGIERDSRGDVKGTVEASGRWEF